MENLNKLALKLEDIQYRYERIGSLLSALQMIAAEVAEIRCIPDDCLENSLFELALNMDENNKGLRECVSAIRKECADRERRCSK